MRSVAWKTIEKALKTNSDVILLPSRTTKGAMVYLRLPGHEESDHRGLWELLALPSPTFYERCPAEDFVDPTAATVESPKGQLIPGYMRFFKRVVAMKHPVTGQRIFKGSEIKRIIPGAFRGWQHGKFKADFKDGNLSDMAKFQQKIPWRRIPHYGDPIGGKRETNTTYTF